MGVCVKCHDDDECDKGEAERTVSRTGDERQWSSDSSQTRPIIS
jgi:hypothetical protein